MANVIAPPVDQYRGTNIVPEENNSIAWEVADFLFGVESIKKILSGDGTWGDALNVGITAATFFIPPAKIGQLGTKALRKVLDETIVVNAATDVLPVAAKAANRTKAEVEAELVRRGKLTYVEPLKPEVPTRSMSEQRFEKITSPEPEVDYSAPPIREVVERQGPTALAERQLRREGGSLRKRNLTDETIDRKTGKQKGNYSEPTEPEVEGLISGSPAKGKPRKDNMGPESDPVEFVDNYLEKISRYRILAKQLKEAEDAKGFRKDTKELKDDEKNLALRKENRSSVFDPENPDAVTPTTEINNELSELQAYFKENHKFFTKLYDDVYGDETIATIKSYAAVAAGKQGAITPEEKLIASLPIRPLPLRPQRGKLSKEATEVRKRVDKQDEMLTAQENKAPMDFEASTFQGGTRLKADSDFTPQLDSKKTGLAPSQSARAEMDELKADLDNAMDNLRKAKTPDQQKLYAKAVEQARKAIQERSKILGFTAPKGAARQEQIDLADELFKIQDVRIILKRTTSTPKGTPSTRNVADRAKHVENIIARESKDFVKGSEDYGKQLKNKREFKNDDGTLNVEKYEKRMQEYRDEVDELRGMQEKAWEKTKELSKQLDDTGIRRFMNRVATNDIDPINRQALIDLIDDLAEQTKDPALKKRIINYANRLRSQEGIDQTVSRKAGMNTRLAKEDAERKARFEAKKAKEINSESNSSAALQKKVKFIQEKNPEGFKKAESQLENLRSDGKIIIAVNPESLIKILEEGKFKNQFQTGKSGGVLEGEEKLFASPNARSATEEKLFGVSSDSADRLIYGFIAPTKGHVLSSFLDQYGKIRVVLKDEVKSRSTFTYSDSLSGDYVPVPMSGKLADGEIFGSLSDNYLENLSKGRGLVNPSGPENRYAEAQIRGQLGIEDIGEIVVDPDTFALLDKSVVDELAQRNIKIVVEDKLKHQAIKDKYDAEMFPEEKINLSNNPLM